MSLFAQRVVVGQSAGEGEGLLVCALGLGSVDETSQCGEVSLAVMVLFDEDPLVEVPGHKVPAIKLDRSAQLRRVQALCPGPLPCARVGNAAIELFDIKPVRD